ncbi:MAG: hypothetical protein LDLANPLL_02347 [Turneriella sp.]|nr:hypothetical protein [Turneriella sp.]
MKAIIVATSLFALVACRAPQARTNPMDPAQQAQNDPVLQDGAPLEAEPQTIQSEGFASWYGKELQGRPTASGEMFDMQKMTAAHRDFPMNSLVLVKNLENGKKAMVKINDRGPYVEGRIIDVSYAAAQELGFAEKGVAKVHLELIQAGEDNFMAKAAMQGRNTKQKPGLKSAEEDIIEPVEFDDVDDGEPLEKPPHKKARKGKLVFLDGKKPKGYTVQVGAFKKKVNAERHRDEILENYHEKSFIATNGKWHFVCLGDFKTREQAKAFLKKLSDDGIDVMYRGKVS